MSKLRPKIGFMMVAYEPEQETAEFIEPYFKKFVANFKNEDFEIIVPPKYVLSEEDAVNQAKFLKQNEIDLFVFMVGTWTNANYTIAALRELSNIPFVMYAFNDLGPGMTFKIGQPTFGFTGAIEVKNSIDQMGYKDKYYFFVGEPSDKELTGKIGKIASAAAVVQKLKKARIGLIGYYTMGMYSATFDPISLKEHMGISVEHIGENYLINEINKSDKNQAKDFILGTVNKCTIMDKAKTSEEDLIQNGKMYLAYKNLQKVFKLDAFNTKCDPELGVHYGMCACLTHSILTDEGTICGCEGDIHQTVSMMVLSYLSGNPVMFLDVVGACKENNSLQFMSCGFSPMGIVDDFKEVKLYPQISMKGKGITQALSLPQDKKVTIFRIDATYPKGNYSGHIISGTSSKTGRIIEEWPSAEVILNKKDDWYSFTQKCTADHFALVRGDYTEELIYFNKILGFENILNI